MPEHGDLCAAALRGVKQRIQSAAAHGVAVAVRNKSLYAVEGNDLVLGIGTVVIAIARHGADGYCRKPAF